MSIITPMVRPMVRPMVTAMGKGGQRTPAQIIQGLFAQGQQGFWLPFTDFASLSQDSAGTLPYTALEQPVGLILDKSKGGGRGPEVVADPEMTTLVGLSNNGNLSSPFEIVPWQGASTALHVVGPRYSGTIIPGVIANTLYYVEARIWVVTGSVYFSHPTATVGGAVVTASSGWQEVKGYISTTSAGLPCLSNQTGSEWYLDRISIKQVLGNHATQPTSTARGVVSARVNAVLNTDSPSAWGYAGSGFSVGAKEADGGWPLTALINSASLLAAVNTDYPIGAGAVTDATIVRSIELQAGTASFVRFGAASGSDAVAVDLVAKAIVSNAGALPVTIMPLADNWVRVEFWSSRASFSASTLSNYLAWGLSQSGGVIGASGQIGSTIKVRKPSYSRQPLGYTAPIPYQRVNTPTDYDAVGFPKYLRLDGTDDFYTCGGGGSTTGFFYSDVVRPTTSTFSALLADNTASGGYVVQRTNTGIYFAANAGAAITSVSLPLAANVQAFVSAMDDGVNLTLQVNGAEASIARPVVTAGASTMYLGRYTTIAQYFNGSMTEPIYRAGPPPSAYERSVIRAYQMQKAGL